MQNPLVCSVVHWIAQHRTGYDKPHTIVRPIIVRPVPFGVPRWANVFNDQLQAILYKRIERRRPSDGRHDSLIAAPQRIFFLMKKGRHSKPICAAAGIAHHGVFASVKLRYLALKSFYFGAVGKPSAANDALDRFPFFGFPKRKTCRIKPVSHYRPLDVRSSATPLHRSPLPRKTPSLGSR